LKKDKLVFVNILALYSARKHNFIDHSDIPRKLLRIIQLYLIIKL